jgi:hypothetical protein
MGDKWEQAATPIDKWEQQATAVGPDESSPLAKGANAFWEWTGKPIMDVMGGASRDPQRAKVAMETLKGIGTGLVNEPARIRQEVTNALGSNTLAGAGSAVIRAIPLIGPNIAQAGDEFNQGKYAEGTGHLAAMLMPQIAHEGGPILERGARTGSAAVRGMAEGTAESLKKAPVSKTGMKVGGVAGGYLGHELGGWRGATLGAPAGAAIGAKVPAVPAALKAGIARAKFRAMMEGLPENPPRTPIWEGKTGTPELPKPPFSSQQGPMGMDAEGNLIPGEFPSGRRPGPAPVKPEPSKPPRISLADQYGLGPTPTVEHPPIEPIPADLPSGRSSANAKQYTPPSQLPTREQLIAKATAEAKAKAAARRGMPTPPEEPELTPMPEGERNMPPGPGETAAGPLVTPESQRIHPNPLATPAPAGTSTVGTPLPGPGMSTDAIYRRAGVAPVEKPIVPAAETPGPNAAMVDKHLRNLEDWSKMVTETGEPDVYEQRRYLNKEFHAVAHDILGKRVSGTAVLKDILGEKSELGWLGPNPASPKLMDAVTKFMIKHNELPTAADVKSGLFKIPAELPTPPK